MNAQIIYSDSGQLTEVRLLGKSYTQNKCWNERTLLRVILAMRNFFSLYVYDMKSCQDTLSNKIKNNFAFYCFKNTGPVWDSWK